MEHSRINDLGFCSTVGYQLITLASLQSKTIRKIKK